MNLSFCGQIESTALAFAISLMLIAVSAQAAEYHPDFMSLDPANDCTAGGNATAKAGVLSLRAPSDSTVQLFNKTISLKEGTISVDARFAANADPIQSHVGVVFDRTAPHNFCSAQFNASGSFTICRCVNGAWQYIRPSSLLPVWKRGTMVWNKLSVQIKGATLKVFVNDTEVFSGAFTPAASGGKIGLLSQDPGSADFRNFKATY